MIYSNDNICEKDRTFVHKVIEYLNMMAGSNFDTAHNVNIQYVLKRKAEGFSFLDFKTVIERKCKEWLNTSMQSNLRPLTLFNQKNFENYLHAPDSKVQSPKSSYDRTKKATDRAESYDWGLGED